jgi:hypothetical protein
VKDWVGVTEILVLISFVAILVTKRKPLKQNWRDWRVLGLGLGVLCFCTGITLRNEFTYTWLNNWIGINNFAWLLSRIAYTLAIFFTVTSRLAIYPEYYAEKTIVLCGLVVTISAITILYPKIVSTPEIPDYSGAATPIAPAWAVINQFMLFYALVAAVFGAMIYWRLFGEEIVLAAKIRWLLFVCLIVNTILLMSSRFLIASSYFIRIPGSVVDIVGTFSDVLKAPMALWLSAFLPSSFFVALLVPVRYCQSLFTIRNLLSLKEACVSLPLELRTLVTLERLTMKDYLSTPTQSIRKITMAILDYKNCIIQLTPKIEQAWLSELLEADESDYEMLVRSYSKIGQGLRKQNRRRDKKSQLTPDCKSGASIIGGPG